MFIILLKFAENKGGMSEFLEGHKAWLKRGFDEGVFLLAGSLEHNLGGGILAQGKSHTELRSRVNEDPLVGKELVAAEILEIKASKADPRLQFLLD